MTTPLHDWHDRLIEDMDRMMDPSYPDRWRLFKVPPKADTLLVKLKADHPAYVEAIHETLTKLSTMPPRDDAIGTEVAVLRRRIADLIAVAVAGKDAAGSQVDTGWLVTRKELSLITGGMVAVKTITHRRPSLPDTADKKGRQKAWPYSVARAWWQSQKFEADIPEDEVEAQRILQAKLS